MKNKNNTFEKAVVVNPVKEKTDPTEEFKIMLDEQLDKYRLDMTYIEAMFGSQIIMRLLCGRTLPTPGMLNRIANEFNLDSKELQRRIYG